MNLLLNVFLVFTVRTNYGWKMEEIASCNISQSGPYPNTYRRVVVKPRKYALRTRAPDIELSDETAALRALLRQQRIKRTKFALLMAYSGQGYCGFQRNPGVKTIEEDLFTALLKARFITEDMIWNQSRSIHFDLASRTDKGVSALGQVVSLKLPINASCEEINKHLPTTIRVFHMERVTQGFSARKFSNARTYSYTLPIYALAPHAVIHVSLREHLEIILHRFIGHHSYHNFTPKKSTDDFGTFFRTITDFTCGSPFHIDGMEFVALTITGRSFLMHQIRKMVALSIAILQGVTEPSTLDRALNQTLSVSIPLAPGPGLILEKVVYKRYNTKYGNDGFHTCLDWSEQHEKVEKFREKFIFSSLLEAEKNKSFHHGWRNFIVTLLTSNLDTEEQSKTLQLMRISFLALGPKLLP